MVKKKEVESCPYLEECPTTMWYSSEQEKFINEVCLTSQYKLCSHFMSLEAIEKIEDLDKLKEYMRNHYLHSSNKRKLNPSRRF